MATAVQSKPLDSRVMSRVWPVYLLVTIGIVGGILAYGVALPLYLLSSVFPRLRRPADWVIVHGVALLMRIQPWFAGTIAVSNRDLPAFGGCLTVSNHRSHLDAFILLSHIQGVRILSRKSLFRIPFLGWMMRAMRQIPVESGNVESFVSAMDRVREWIEQGERVHVFPEMTRCPPGMRGTQEFIAAPFHAAIKAHAAVFPIVFLGTDDVWPKGSFSLSFRRKVEARLLDPILPGQFTSAAELRSEARRRIDEALR